MDCEVWDCLYGLIWSAQHVSSHRASNLPSESPKILFSSSVSLTTFAHLKHKASTEYVRRLMQRCNDPPVPFRTGALGQAVALRYRIIPAWQQRSGTRLSVLLAAEHVRRTCDGPPEMTTTSCMLRRKTAPWPSKPPKAFLGDRVFCLLPCARAVHDVHDRLTSLERWRASRSL